MYVETRPSDVGLGEERHRVTQTLERTSERRHDSKTGPFLSSCHPTSLHLPSPTSPSMSLPAQEFLLQVNHFPCSFLSPSALGNVVILCVVGTGHRTPDLMADHGLYFKVTCCPCLAIKPQHANFVTILLLPCIILYSNETCSLHGRIRDG
jgi:hypothetical protein